MLVDTFIKIDNYSVTRVTSVKDLGIIFDSELSFTSHIHNFSKKDLKMFYKLKYR